jgi:hypothetical protein
VREKLQSEPSAPRMFLSMRRARVRFNAVVFAISIPLGIEMAACLCGSINRTLTLNRRRQEFVAVEAMTPF